MNTDTDFTCVSPDLTMNPLRVDPPHETSSTNSLPRILHASFPFLRDDADTLPIETSMRESSTSSTETVQYPVSRSVTASRRFIFPRRVWIVYIDDTVYGCCYSKTLACIITKQLTKSLFKKIEEKNFKSYTMKYLTIDVNSDHDYTIRGTRDFILVSYPQILHHVYAYPVKKIKNY